MRIVFCDHCSQRTKHFCATCEPTGKAKAIIDLSRLAAGAKTDRRAIIAFCATNCNPQKLGHHKDCYYWIWNDDGELCKARAALSYSALTR